MARMVAFWTLAVLLFYGCVSLNTELASRFPDNLGRAIGGARIPLLGIDVTPAFLVSLVVFFGAFVLLYRWQQTPKTADLLIDTESELRKVTWPTLNEAINSSVIVIVCVAFLMAFLAGSDWVLGRWATFILTGGGS
jgi:preprotein translocase SecE subunit